MSTYNERQPFRLYKCKKYIYEMIATWETSYTSNSECTRLDRADSAIPTSNTTDSLEMTVVIEQSVCSWCSFQVLDIREAQGSTYLLKNWHLYQSDDDGLDNLSVLTRYQVHGNWFHWCVKTSQHPLHSHLATSNRKLQLKWLLRLLKVAK